MVFEKIVELSMSLSRLVNTIPNNLYNIENFLRICKVKKNKHRHIQEWKLIYKLEIYT